MIEAIMAAYQIFAVAVLITGIIAAIMLPFIIFDETNRLETLLLYLISPAVIGVLIWLFINLVKGWCP